MDVFQGYRLSQGQQFVIAFDVRGVINESLAAKVGFSEFQLLDHGTHGAIHYQNALLQLGVQKGGTGCLLHGVRYLMGG